MLDIVLKIVYICGLLVMMDVIKDILFELGMFEVNIKIEVFGGVSLKKMVIKMEVVLNMFVNNMC